MSPLSRCLLGLLLLVTAACAPAVQEDVEEGQEAFSEARGGDLAGLAADLATRAGKHDPTVFRRPVSEAEADQVPSLRFAAWNVALLAARGTEGDRLQGFLFLPKENAPGGSFALALADENQHIVATAAYVPDGTDDPGRWTQDLLDALERDSTTTVASPASGVAPQNLLRAGAASLANLATRLIAGTKDAAVSSVERKALVTARAHVTSNVSKSIWRDFAALFADPKVVDDYVAQLVAIRTAHAARKVVLVESSRLCPDGDVQARHWADAVTKVHAHLDSELGSRADEIVLAVSGSGTENAAIVLWALEHRVPVVLTVPSGVGGETRWVLDELARSLTFHLPELELKLGRLAHDPGTAKLVSVVRERVTQLDPDRAELAAFAPRWALADQALAIELTEPVYARTTGWLRAFDVITTIR